jgi:hypothetical protein
MSDSAGLGDQSRDCEPLAGWATPDTLEIGKGNASLTLW